jgi:hypothetical protein
MKHLRRFFLRFYLGDKTNPLKKQSESCHHDARQNGKASSSNARCAPISLASSASTLELAKSRINRAGIGTLGDQ